ncbi:hypothetical protein DICVIV_12717 [Dictyocaulus viviparus]|uniref:Uncharacterized protein n=1 Tax=Dictyocaulus viviparus TaxID=29172 RepID=A0A0D8XG15_DICVI|nr:hypothetical protein DICVIV_12717 [Dictyocaulus viviparus]
MDSRLYIKSFYYPFEPETKSRCQGACQVTQGVHENAKQAQRVPLPTLLEQCSTSGPVTRNPLIESTYCEPMNSYTIEYFMQGHPRVGQTKVKDDVANPPISTVPDALDEPFSYKPTSPSQRIYQAHHRIAPEHTKPTIVDASLASGIEQFAATSKSKPLNVNQEMIYETSEYAWQRDDEELLAQYGNFHTQHYVENSAPTISEELEDRTMKQVHPQNTEAMPKYSIEEFSAPWKKTHREADVYSEYLGFPDDLYLAYRSKPTMTYKPAPVLRSKAPPNYEIRAVGSAAFNIVEQPPASAIENDTIGSEQTPEKMPPYRSRFKSQINPEDIPAPEQLPFAQRYTPQYSVIGNAFTPVGHMAISEYQLEDLNDLVSCIDVL